MSAASIATIRSAVLRDLGNSKIVDIDEYCRTFSAQFPELTRKQIQDVVLEVVTTSGGAGAVWGLDQPTRSRDAGTGDLVNHAAQLQGDDKPAQ